MNHCNQFIKNLEMITNSKKIQQVLICYFLISSFFCHAQNMLWEKDLKEQLFKVSWIEQSNDGVILAAGDKGLLGLDNNSGDLLWQNKDLKAIDRNTFQKIDGLPLITVEASSMFGKKKSLIINSYSGDVLFDSKEENLKIGNYHILSNVNSIVFEARQGDNQKLLLFNYETAKTSWLTDVGPADGGIKGMVKKAVKGFSFLNDTPTLIGSSHMMVVEGKKIHVLEMNSGKIVWSTPFKKNIKAAIFSPVDNKIYVGVKEKLQVLDATNGQDVTSGKMKLEGSFVNAYTNKDNNLVIVSSGGFNILNPSTGKFLWKKSYGINGLYNVIDMSDHYLAIGGEEKSSAIARVSKEGKKVWKEKLDGYAYHVQPIEKGIFYLSTEKSNILSYGEGDKIWKKDIKFKAIPSVAVDEKNGEVIFYEGKELYRFNLNSGNIETIAEGIKFEKAKKSTFHLETRPNGYFLHSDQHVSFFDKSGKTAYNNYHPPVSNLNISSALSLTAKVAGVDLDIAGSMETIKSLNALAHGSVMSSGDQNEAASQKSSGGLYTGGSPILEVTKTRFFNSKKVKDHNYILTNQNGKNQIVMVNKDSGKIDKTIALDDKTPSYITDDVDQRVFLNENNQMVRCYDMK